jgi:hypothetical protein
MKSTPPRRSWIVSSPLNSASVLRYIEIRSWQPCMFRLISLGLKRHYICIHGLVGPVNRTVVGRFLIGRRDHRWMVTCCRSSSDPNVPVQTSLFLVLLSCQNLCSGSYSRPLWGNGRAGFPSAHHEPAAWTRARCRIIQFLH